MPTCPSQTSGAAGAMTNASDCWVFPAWKSWILVTSAGSPPATGSSGCFPKAELEKLCTQV